MKIQRWQRDGLPNEAVMRTTLEEEGYSVCGWTDQPDATYPPHEHADDQSHWVVRGAIALRIGDKEYVLRAGDRDWMPAGTVHAARVVGDEAVTYLIGSKTRAR